MTQTHPQQDPDRGSSSAPSARQPSPVVELVGVEKAFDTQVILRGVDLSVRAKETMVIIGRSGTGKSVTLRHMVGLERPDRGRVSVFGEDVAGIHRPKRESFLRRIGFLFQSGALLNWMTIAENVALPVRVHARATPEEEIETLVIAQLRRVGLESARNKLPGEISGGMKKRAALARATILDPELVLYDEPTSGLDPVIASSINDLIVKTGSTMGTTQVVVTHDMESAYHIADSIAMLYEGRVVALGTPEEIRHSENEVVQQFIHGKTDGPLIIDA